MGRRNELNDAMGGRKIPFGVPVNGQGIPMGLPADIPQGAVVIGVPPGRQQEPELPEAILAIQAANALRAQVNDHEREARELLESSTVEPGPERERLLAYHARLRAAKAKVDAIHAQALAGASSLIIEDIEGELANRIAQARADGERRGLDVFRAHLAHPPAEEKLIGGFGFDPRKHCARCSARSEEGR